MSKQVGPLTKIERQYIIDFHKRVSIEEIAEELNRTPDLIKRHLLQNGLYVEKTTAELEQEARMKMVLYNLAYWPSIVQCYEDEEIEYFENNWLAIMKQLNEDVSYTEQLYIKDWVQLEIEKNRLMRSQKETMGAIRELKAKIKGWEDAKDAGTIEPINEAMLAGCKSELQFMRAAEGQHISNLTKVNSDIKAISGKVKADREQRRNVQTNADTYWGLVALMEEEKFRADESYRAELGRLAQEKTRADLMELTEFIDDTVDYPLLNAETMEKIKREEDD